jgi:hypothetical protein
MVFVGSTSRPATRPVLMGPPDSPLPISNRRSAPIRPEGRVRASRGSLDRHEGNENFAIIGLVSHDIEIESDGANESLEAIDHTLVEAIELAASSRSHHARAQGISRANPLARWRR